MRCSGCEHASHDNLIDVVETMLRKMSALLSCTFWLEVKFRLIASASEWGVHMSLVLCDRRD